MAAEQETPDVAELTIGVLGGTGDQGRGLAYRLAAAGHPVIIGSRSAERAQAAADSLNPVSGDAAAAAVAGTAVAGTAVAGTAVAGTAVAGTAVAGTAVAGTGMAGGGAGGTGAVGLVRGTTNTDAAAAADVVIVAVPWEGHRELLESLAGPLTGKIVIDCVNPMGFDKQGAYPLPVEEGSAAQQAAAVLPGSRVVGAFHHVSAVVLLDPEVTSIDLDVMVLGDDREATDLVQALASRLPGVRGVYAGRLRNCGQVEALTANLVSVNRRYKAHAGLRITDI